MTKAGPPRLYSISCVMKISPKELLFVNLFNGYYVNKYKKSMDN